MTFGDTCENGIGLYRFIIHGGNRKGVWNRDMMYGLSDGEKRGLGGNVIRDVCSGKYYPVDIRSHSLFVRNLKRTVQKEDEIYDWSYDEKRNAGKIINGLFHKEAVPI